MSAFDRLFQQDCDIWAAVLPVSISVVILATYGILVGQSSAVLATQASVEFIAAVLWHHAVPEKRPRRMFVVVFGSLALINAAGALGLV